MAKSLSTSISVTCEGEAWIEDFDTEVLVQELKKRKAEVETKTEYDGLIEVHDAMADRRYADAQLMLQKIIWPKWKSLDRCLEDFAKQNLKE